MPGALGALAVLTLFVPLGAPGCSGAVVELLRGEQVGSPFVEPKQDVDELARRTQAVVDAQAVVEEKKQALSVAEQGQRQTQAARKAADDAEAAARDLELDSIIGGKSWALRSAEGDVTLAESRVDSARSRVSSLEGMTSGSLANGLGNAYTQEMLSDAREDLRSAQSELVSARAELATARAGDATASQSKESARTTADALSAEAETAESAAAVAMATAEEDLSLAEEAAADAGRRKSSFAVDQQVRVAMAFSEHQEASRATSAANAARDDCDHNTRSNLAASAVFGAGAAGLVAAPFLPRPGRRFGVPR